MKLPVFARIGFGIAVFTALLLLLAAAENPVSGVPFALLFIASAIGLWHGKAWSGYGPALLILIFAAAPLLRLSDISVPIVQLVVVVAINLAAAVLLFLAGRSLSGRTPSRAWPWLTACTATAIFILFFQPMIVPTGAMEDTILRGDSLLARRVLAKNPARGDVIIHRYPVDPRQTFLKRVVGLPGDRIHFEDKRLFVNGVELKEPYAKHVTDYIDLYRDQFPKQEPNIQLFPSGQSMLRDNVRNGVLIVPEGKLFVLGDNRDNSLDSRYWGFIDNKMITGKPVIVLFSSDVDPQQRGTGIQGLTAPIRHARWNRTFKLLTSI